MNPVNHISRNSVISIGKKLIPVASLVLLSAALLTGCGGKKETDEEISIDITQLCEDLQGTISSETSVVSSDMLASTYFLDMDQVEESTAALNSGASACEVAVIKCKTSDYVEDAKDLFENRVSTQSELFASYDAPEVAKLESAILKSTGNYVVFCVTDDTETAEEIIEAAGF